MVFFLSVFVLSMLVNNYADTVMKIRINRRLPAEERFSWWSRNSWKVARKYGEFCPDSYLPLIARCSFWLCASLLAGLLLVTLRNAN